MNKYPTLCLSRISSKSTFSKSSSLANHDMEKSLEIINTLISLKANTTITNNNNQRPHDLIKNNKIFHKFLIKHDDNYQEVEKVLKEVSDFNQTVNMFTKSEDKNSKLKGFSSGRPSYLSKLDE